MSNKENKRLVFGVLVVAVLLALFLVSQNGVLGFAAEKQKITFFTADWCGSCQELKYSDWFSSFVITCLVNRDTCEIVEINNNNKQDLRKNNGELYEEDFRPRTLPTVLIDGVGFYANGNNNDDIGDVKKRGNIGQLQAVLEGLLKKIQTPQKSSPKPQPQPQSNSSSDELNKLESALEWAITTLGEIDKYIAEGKNLSEERKIYEGIIEQYKKRITELKGEDEGKVVGVGLEVGQDWKEIITGTVYELWEITKDSSGKVSWVKPVEPRMDTYVMTKKSYEEMRDSKNGFPSSVVRIKIIDGPTFCRNPQTGGWSEQGELQPQPKAEVEPSFEELRNSQIERLPPRENTKKANNIYEDILNHNKEDRKIYRSQATTIHEGTHEATNQATNDIRRKMRERGVVEWDRYDGFYIGDSRYLVLEEPGINKTTILSAIPPELWHEDLRTYFDSNIGPSGPHNSNYIHDEWTAEIMGVTGSLELMDRGEWNSPAENRSLIMGYTFASLALASKVKYEYSNYWNNHPEYREFIAFNLIKAKQAYDRTVRDYPDNYFNIRDVDKELHYLINGSDIKVIRIREVIKEVLGASRARGLFGI